MITSYKVFLGAGFFSFLLVSVGCKSEAEEVSKQAQQEVKEVGYSVEITPEYIDRIKQKFSSVRADLEVEKIEPSEVEGIYQVTFKKNGSIYMAANGDHFFSGDLFELSNGQIVNVTEEKSNGPRAELMAKVDRNDMVIFSPKGEVKASVSVFTDVDCGYCRKLHKEVPKLNEMGIEVKYLAYPRAGIGSPSYEKIASAWCSDDRKEAMNILKAGGSIDINVCKGNPVADQYELGLKVGLNGTPAIVLDSGRLIPGYMPAEQLAKTLGI